MIGLFGDKDSLYKDKIQMFIPRCGGGRNAKAPI